MLDRTQLAELSDQDLVIAARHGNQHAFGELVARYQQKVIQVVYRMCGEPELAEEAAQEAFISAWQNLHKVDPERPLRNWLYRMATNAAIDRLRQIRPSDDIDQLSLASQEDNPEHSIEGKQQAESIRIAVINLPLASRSVLILREYEGLSYQEISDTLQIPVGTVMSRLNYARTQLRHSLGHILEAG